MTGAIRWTPGQLADYQKKSVSPRKTTGKEKMQALGRMAAGSMNKTESAYGALLDVQKNAGEVLWYRFEGLKFRLADKTFYTPDFAVMLASGELQAHEVKGFWTDDARVKIKVAADMYPIQFIAVKKTKSGWEKELF